MPFVQLVPSLHVGFLHVSKTGCDSMTHCGVPGRLNSVKHDCPSSRQAVQAGQQRQHSPTQLRLCPVVQAHVLMSREEGIGIEYTHPTHSTRFAVNTQIVSGDDIRSAGAMAKFADDGPRACVRTIHRINM